MTRAQILTFTIIARCYYASFSACVVNLAVIGDPTFNAYRDRLIIANMIIKRLKCYDPDDADNCLTFDQMYSLMQNLMTILNICGDAYTLVGSDTTCCDPMYGTTILNP